MSSRTKLLLSILSLCGLATACGDDLPKATLITHMRLLGAKVEVTGDATRSSPKPGEAALVTYVMGYPSVEDDDTDLSSMFIACTAPSQYTGIPICQELIDAAKTGSDDDGAAPAAPVPDRLSCKGFENTMLPASGGIAAACVSGTPKMNVAVEAKSKIARKLVRGVICKNGTPVLVPADPKLFLCEKTKGVKEADFEELAVMSTVMVQHDADTTNETPSFADATLKRGSQTWNMDAMLPATDDDCIDATKADMLTLSDGRGEEINLSFVAKAREKLTDGDPELLEFSAFATAGEIERRFVVFDVDSKVVSGKLSGDWKWKLPQAEREKIGKDGKLVRFYFTMLDRRGGFDITTRALCVQK